MDNKSQKLIGSTLILTVSTLIVKFIGLVFKLPLSYIISDEGMNYFNTAYSVYTFFYILSTAGVPKAVSVVTASTLGKSGNDSARKIYTVALRIFTAIALCLSLIFILLSPYLSSLFGSSKMVLTMISIAPSVVFVAASGVIRGYFIGRLDFLPIAISEMIAAAGKLILGLLFSVTAAKMDLEIHKISALAILGVTFGSLFGFLYLYSYERKKTKIERQDKTVHYNYNGKFSEILKISIPITASTAVGAIINLADIAVIMNLLKSNGYSELQSNILYGNYTTLVVPMFNLVGALLSPIGTVILPAMIGKERESFDRILKNGIKTACYISMPLFVIFATFSTSILRFIFDDSGAYVAAPLLSLVAPSFIFMSITHILNTALEAKGKYYAPLASLTVGGITKILISISLLPIDTIGLLAAPIGTVICYFLSMIISVILIFKESRDILSKINTPLMISMVLSIFSVIPAKLFELRANIANFYIKAILSAMIFVLIYGVFYIFLLYLGKKSSKKQQILQNFK